MRRAIEGSELALGLAAELWNYWLVRGYRQQGLDWLERALLLPGPDATTARAKALAGAALLARLGGNAARARPPAEHGVTVGRAAGSPRAVTTSLNVLITLAGWAGDYDQACNYCDASVQVAREMGSLQFEGTALFIPAETALHAGRYADVREVAGRAIDLLRAVDHREGPSVALARLGMAEALDGRIDEASRYLGEALGHVSVIRFPSTGAWCCEGMALVAADRGDPVRAARLLGAADALRRAGGVAIQPAETAARAGALSVAGAVRPGLIAGPTTARPGGRVAPFCNQALPGLPRAAVA